MPKGEALVYYSYAEECYGKGHERDFRIDFCQKFRLRVLKTCENLVKIVSTKRNLNVIVNCTKIIH